MLRRLEKQDVRVQLIRILACLIVIVCHSRLNPVTDNILDKSTLFIHCFFDDGVAIFFLIMGFFIFNKSYKKIITKAVTGILFPTIVIMVISMVLSDWANNVRALSDCILHPYIDIRLIIKSILSRELYNVPISGHLWYINSYLEIVVLVPVLKLLCKRDNDASSSARRWVIFIATVNILLKDFQAILPLGINPFMIFDIPVFLVLCGYSLWNYNEKIIGNKKIRIISLCCASGINVIRFILQVYLFSKDINNDYFYYWNTGTACIFTVSFVIFFMTFRFNINKVTLVINYIGGKTFMIYLIHALILWRFNSIGIRDVFYDFWLGRGDSVVRELGFNASYALLIFSTALLISIIWGIIKSAVCKCFKSIKAINGSKCII